jgi:uncharacterized protein DUF4019
MNTTSAPNFGQELPSARRRRKRNPVTWIISGILLLLLLYSCGRSAYGVYKIANSATERFHQQLNQTQYEEIYADASDEFRNHGTREESLAVFQKVYENLGAQKSSSMKNINVNRNNKGTFVTLVYDSAFEQGRADEQFVWRVEGDQAKLYGYHAESDKLR